MLCGKPPKGFEKYFKPGGAKELKETPAREAKETKGKDGKTETSKEAPKVPPPTSKQPGSSKPYDQWSFGLFGGTGRGYVEYRYYLVYYLAV